MNILHVSTSDVGGGSLAAVRLHEGLLQVGVDSNILFLKKRTEPVQNSFYFPEIKRTIWRKLQDRSIFFTTAGYQNSVKLRGKMESDSIFTFGQSDYDITQHPAYLRADIINLHWTSNFLDYRFFKKNKKPVVWTLHDVNPFSGGCHYPAACEKYIEDCADCPQLAGTSNTGNAHKNILYKKKALENSKLHIVTLNRWMLECSKSSSIFKNFEHSIIPNGMDLDRFDPTSVEAARKHFDLPHEKKIFGFVAAYISRVKGMDILKESIEKLAETSNGLNDTLFCYIGREIKELERENVRFVGHLSNDKDLAMFYSSLDYFLLPSRQDNLPNVMLESMACGVPVIAFPVGGVKEVVKTSVNGILTDRLGSQELTEAIGEALDEKYAFEREDVRKFVEDNYSMEMQISGYDKLYQKILGN